MQDPRAAEHRRQRRQPDPASRGLTNGHVAGALIAAAPASAGHGTALPLEAGLHAWMLVGIIALALYFAASSFVRRRVDVADPDGRTERRLRRLVFSIIALFSGTVLLTLVLSLQSSQRETVERTRQASATFAHLAGQHVSGRLDSVDIALRLITRAGHFSANALPRQQTVLQDLLTSTIENLPFVQAIWVSSPDGRLLNGSGAAPGAGDPADRRYFQVHRERPGLGLFIDAPVQDAQGRWLIPLSRRIDNPDGSFGGVVTAALDPEALSLPGQSVDLGQDGFVALVAADGTLIHAQGPAQAGARRRSAGMFPGHPGAAAAGLHMHPQDGIERVLGHRRVDDRDLTVLVGLGVRENLAGWYPTALTYAGGSLVLLVLVAALGYRLLDELARRQRQQLRIERLNRIQLMLSSINALTVRTDSTADLFNGACRIAVEQGGFDVAWIDAVEAPGSAPHPVASAGHDAGFILGAPGEPHDTAPGPVRATRPEDEAGALMRLQASPQRRRALERGYRSALTLPLFRGGEAVASLSLLTRKRDFFDADEVQLLDGLASDLSYALDHIATRARAEYLALYDPLTGLPNRTLFIDRMRQRLHAATGSSTLWAVARLDIARFRQINDTVGWHAGDDLLCAIARRLEHALGSDGLVARTERDHFAIALSGGETAAELGMRADRLLRECFDTPYSIDNRELHIGTRMGIAVHPDDGSDVETLLRNADVALHNSRDGAECVVFYEPVMNARVAESLATENRLRTALERHQFVLHYQPKFDARSGALAGLEGLIRWNDPEGGLVPPGEFISILEKTGLILEVGHWAMEQAVRDYRRWHEEGLLPPRIAINVSALQLHEAAFADRVRDALGDEAGSPAGLELEITESMLMSGVEASAEKLEAVRDLGVRIAIDDFGTGYSSLQYIARLPLDTLKIDRSFVVGMTRNPTDREIVASVISLAHQLNLNVVAEGVEADDQARLLRSLDCDEMQGFLFSPPLPPDQIESMMLREIRSSSNTMH